MKIRNEICDLIDRGKKGYITIGDVGVATFYVVIITVIPYLMYCGLPMWKEVINNERWIFSDFSVLEIVGFYTGTIIIALSIFVMIIFVVVSIDTLSEITVVKCKRKEK